MDQFFTGVGSRKTPPAILEIMSSIAKKLSGRGYTLRSGGADGADSAFQRGAGSSSIIFRPEQSNAMAEQLAMEFHPVWERLSPYVRKLHGRNAFQVLGLDLKTPSKCLVCWTPDGCNSHATRSIRTGGTGTAISIADSFGVPVYNLANQLILERWIKWLAK